MSEITPSEQGTVAPVDFTAWRTARAQRRAAPFPPTDDKLERAKRIVARQGVILEPPKLFFRVNPLDGHGDPHLVLLTPDVAVCDCDAWSNDPRRTCEHVLAALIVGLERVFTGSVWACREWDDGPAG